VGRVGVVISGLVGCVPLVVLMSGCGSGGQAAKPTTESVRVGRLTEIFDTSLPANPAQASVIQGFRADTIAWDKSQEDLSLLPTIGADVTGAAMTNLDNATNEMVSQHIVPAGTDRYFKTRVSMLKGDNATIETCDDGSKFVEVNPATGAVDAAFTAKPDQQYLSITWQMTDLNGHWAISSVSVASLPSALAKPCQP
jgi:hypothetical protein